MPQELFLFNDTVLANITLHDPDISEEDAIVALRDAGAWEFVAALPEGIHSIVGEQGAQLSGGQRQRIALARAQARKPSLLILDEPTTALDPETEAEICATLSKLSGSVTILAISHQQALRDVANVCYRIEGGRIFLDSQDPECPTMPLAMDSPSLPTPEVTDPITG